MLDVLNVGSGGPHASRDRFPKVVLPRTFDCGFTTGLMVVRPLQKAAGVTVRAQHR